MEESTLPSAENALPPSSPFSAATANLQVAARWIVTALAGVGGVLVAGVPLTGLGHLSGFWDAAPAVGSLAVALIAIAVVIPKVAKVFTTPYVTLSRLAAAEIPEYVGQDTSAVAAIIDKIHESSDELFADQAEELGSLHSRLAELNAKLRARNDSGGRHRDDVGLRSPGMWARARSRRDKVDDTFERDYAAAAELRATAQRVVDFANYEATRRTFVALYPSLAVAGFAVAIGVGFYAYMVSRPEVSLITTPRPVMVSLPPGSAEAKQLGPKCDVENVAAVAVDDTLVRPTVTTIPTPTCQAAKFRVPKGSVVVPVVFPEVSLKSSPETQDSFSTLR